METNDFTVFQPQVEGKDLLGLISGYQQANFLYQAFTTGIFECLADEPQKIEDIAEKMGYQADRTRFFLDALTAMELAVKEGEQYRITPLAKTYLCRDNPFFLGDLLDMQFSIKQGSAWSMMGSWLKGNSTGEGHNPQAIFQASFVRAMAQRVLSDNSIFHTVEMISRHPGFAEATNILDLGGGHGLFPMALQMKKPDLEITVFDLPQVREVSEEYVKIFEREVYFCPGNFYEDELPGNQDIILAFDILHPVVPAQKEQVFAKAYRALRKGGYLFYKLWFLDESRTKSRRAALFALKCKIINSDSHVYTYREATEMLEKIGFKIEGMLTVGDNASNILVARK